MAKTVPLKERGLGKTSRRDTWWVTPLITFIVLTGFIVYATWAALQNAHYTYGPYLSPFYSPVIFGDPAHAWLGPRPGWWPGWLPFSPALIILPFPALFRFTCYYYRGAYYKAFWADPPACSVGEPRKSYRGEQTLPLVLQNIHRYFLYIALIFLGILLYDVYRALWFVDAATGGREFGIGVGTLVLALNVFLLGGYTLGCHSLRHLVGGGLTQISKRPVRHSLYTGVSSFNRRHMLFAWLSLFSVGFADLYVRMCAMGIWTDWRLI